MKTIAILFILLLSAIMLISGSSFTKTGISLTDSSQVCIVSGETIGDAGVKYKYLDKEITFCCSGCESKFKKEPAKYLKNGIKCPVCDEDDAKASLSAVKNDVKYYFCGNGCKNKFEADPDSYLNKYNN